jgi:hypothetical protein
MDGSTIPLTPIPEARVGNGESKLFDFPEAMKKIIEGKKVARVEWNNTDYCFLNGEWLSIHRNNNDYIWKVNDGDMNGVDWFMVGEVN